MILWAHFSLTSEVIMQQYCWTQPIRLSRTRSSFPDIPSTQCLLRSSLCFYIIDFPTLLFINRTTKGIAGLRQHTPSAVFAFAQVTAMSTTLFDPMLLRDLNFVVYWKDSCLAGYHEVNFIAPSLKIRRVHMVKKDDPRCADMVCSIVLPRLAPKLIYADIIGPSYCE